MGDASSKPDYIYYNENGRLLIITLNSALAHNPVAICPPSALRPIDHSL